MKTTKRITDTPLYRDSGRVYFGLNVAARKIGLTRDQLDDVLEGTEACRDMMICWGVHQNTKGDGSRTLLEQAGIDLLRTFRKRHRNINWDDIPDEVREAPLTSKAQDRYNERQFQAWLNSEDGRPAREAARR